MIYIQVILAWLIIALIIIFGLFLLMKFCDYMNAKGVDVIWSVHRSPLHSLDSIFVYIVVLGIFFIVFASSLFIWGKFIHNKWPQKPKPAIVEQQTRTNNQQNLSQEEQIVKNTLQEN